MVQLLGPRGFWHVRGRELPSAIPLRATDVYAITLGLFLIDSYTATIRWDE